MLVSVEMKDLTFVKVKGILGEKKVVCTPFVAVETADLATIMSNPKQYKGVLFNYVGRLQDLLGYTIEKEGYELISFAQFGDLTQLQNYMHDVPPYLTLVVQLAEDYTDLRTLKAYCNVYPNLRFIGGNLLQVEGLRTGYVDKSFLNGKQKSDELVIVGLDPVFNLYSLEHIGEPEFIKAKEVTAVKTGSRKKEKVVGEKKEKQVKEPTVPKEKKTKYDVSILFG